jgi:hypothetical protein
MFNYPHLYISPYNHTDHNHQGEVNILPATFGSEDLTQTRSTGSSQGSESTWLGAKEAQRNHGSMVRKSYGYYGWYTLRDFLDHYTVSLYILCQRINGYLMFP